VWSLPPAPAPAPAAKPKPKPVHRQAPSRSNSGPSGRSAPATQRHSQTTVQAQPITRAIQVSVAPRGGVQAGGGAMADRPAQAGLLGLGAGLVLVSMAGGGLAIRRRREQP
jgi:hypothetical protein